MVKIDIPYVRVKVYIAKDGARKDLYYWEPKKQYLVQGRWLKTPFSLSGAQSLDTIRDMNDKLQKWRKGREEAATVFAAKEGTFHWLANQYMQDHMYLKLSPKAKKEYKRILDKHLIPVIGDFPIKAVTRIITRSIYNAEAHKPRQAQDIVKVGKRVFKYGRDIEKAADNPFAEMEITRSAMREQIWKPEQILRFQMSALDLGRSSMWMAVEIMATIGTDSQTTRYLARTNYTGTNISYKRGKTKIDVNIPLKSLPDLKAAFDSFQSEDVLYVVNEQTGASYTDTNFNHVFREIREHAGIPADLQPKDLRRTAVGRLHKAGCTVLEIASYVGWSPKYCNDVIRHYFTDKEETAGNAAAKVAKKSEESRKWQFIKSEVKIGGRR